MHALPALGLCLRPRVVRASGATTFTTAPRSKPSLPAPIRAWSAATPGTRSLGLIINSGDTIDGLTYLYTPVFDGFSLAVTNALALIAPHALGTYYAPGDYFSGVGPGDAFTIVFSTPVDTFGVWVNTADLVPGAVTITTNTGEVAVSGSDPIALDFPYGQFVGIATATAFTSVTFTVRDGFGAAFDGMTWVEAPLVPAPGSGALSMLAIATMAGSRRRR